MHGLSCINRPHREIFKVKIPDRFRGPVTYGGKNEIIWFYNTEHGPELSEQFKTWQEVKKHMIEKGILYLAGHRSKRLVGISLSDEDFNKLREIIPKDIQFMSEAWPLPNLIGFNGKAVFYVRTSP